MTASAHRVVRCHANTLSPPEQSRGSAQTDAAIVRVDGKLARGIQPVHQERNRKLGDGHQRAGLEDRVDGAGYAKGKLDRRSHSLVKSS